MPTLGILPVSPELREPAQPVVPFGRMGKTLSRAFYNAATTVRPPALYVLPALRDRSICFSAIIEPSYECLVGRFSNRRRREAGQ
jgi:hypothetical protein